MLVYGLSRAGPKYDHIKLLMHTPFLLFILVENAPTFLMSTPLSELQTYNLLKQCKVMSFFLNLFRTKSQK